ncbi:UBX domain-containing protein 4 [Harpegnathos saltator]|uniref:UBX domain-containing protein 4 n=1 Tax=Harpegnathos saltator TaxID=610380 RepID=E2BY21_HARSA|nr:UBX domain-containing protein 4 [Harpegnathos saltator]EFN79394.1 UBX domain-containing protein 2 [Harpegnathos saltator]
MKWFVGSINEAVVMSKSRKAIFVVFVEGKDDTSAQLGQVINTPEVSSCLEEEHFVAIRVESESEAYGFFVQIYQLVPVPSLFFIGENGTPLEIIAGTITPDDLVSKINNVLIQAGKKNKNFSLSLIDAEQKAAIASSSTNTAAESAESTESNIDNVKCNSNIDSTYESTTADISNNKDVATESAESNIDNVKCNSNIDSVYASTTADISNSKDVAEDSVKATTSLNKEDKDNNEASQENIEVKQGIQIKELTAEEKLERAQIIMEFQRRQRLEEELKKEREQEIERRKRGRDVQKMRQMQQDLEMKQACEERMREKAAEAAAREKVKQQIVQDKLERKQKELALQQQLQQQQQSQQEQPKQNPVPSNATVTRIQFRLPSGSSHTGQFEPSSTLRTLRDYVIGNIELPFRKFSMSTSFPRRILTDEEDDKTLLQLELVPTAVILILPLKNSNAATTVTSAQDVGFLSRYMWPLFTPVYNFIFVIIGYFFGTNRNTDRQRSNSDSNNRETRSADGATPPNRQNVAESSGLVRRYLGNREGTTIRARGNIHRLHSDGDDNDENNTWNGNSTQQM